MNYTIPQLLTLPDNFLLEEVFPQFSPFQLSKLCSTHTRFNKICSNDRLWQIKTFDEYPAKVDQKPSSMSWKQYYRELYNIIRELPVYVASAPNLGKINLDRNSTIQSLIDNVLKLVKQRYGYDINDLQIIFNGTPINGQQNMIAISDLGKIRVRGLINDITYIYIVRA